MSLIHLLDQGTINKIAAGEVVERPISIIKELVENSIDAKATAITIDIEDGGIKFIRITDNGTGMAKEDVKNAFLRHATSKIKDASDLSHIASLGFRGEALASIAAVSMTECITKTSDELTGIHYRIEGGIEKGFGEIGCPNGTTFLIKELFYNVPARKKFLKAPQTEANYITEFIQRIALSHVGISFKYSINGHVKLHTSGNYSLIDCIYQVFGKDFAKNSLPVSLQHEKLSVQGFVGQPILSRGNRQYEIYFVNGRYIKSPFIQKGIEEGMKEAMMINQFPFAVLFLTIPYEEVDVNVHPNKMQVRFSEEGMIQNVFREAVISAFQQRDKIPVASLHEKEDKLEDQRIKVELAKFVKDAPEPFEVKRQEQHIHSSEYVNYAHEKSNETISQVERETREIHSAETTQITQPTQPNQTMQSKLSRTIEKPIFKNEPSEEIKMDLFLDEQKIIKHKIIGQVFKTYWLVEFHQELYIIDQHAAHEKVLYEAWLKSVQEMNISSQLLLEPFVYTLSDAEFTLFNQLESELTVLGFDVEAFGGTSIIVKSVPYLLNEPLTDIDFIYFFDQVYAGEASLRKEDNYLAKLASIACKAAIKGNHRLSVVEYEHLIAQLLRLDDPYHCPHGRPTMIRMSQYELDRKFRRIV